MPSAQMRFSFSTAGESNRGRFASTKRAKTLTLASSWDVHCVLKRRFISRAHITLYPLRKHGIRDGTVPVFTAAQLRVFCSRFVRAMLPTALQMVRHTIPCHVPLAAALASTITGLTALARSSLCPGSNRDDGDGEQDVVQWRVCLQRGRSVGVGVDARLSHVARGAHWSPRPLLWFQDLLTCLVKSFYDFLGVASALAAPGGCAASTPSVAPQGLACTGLVALRTVRPAAVPCCAPLPVHCGGQACF